MFENGVKGVSEVVEYAKSKGITALYEPQGYLFNGVENIEKLTSIVDAGIVADFGNVFFVDERIAPIIERCPDKIKNVHVKDYQVVEDAPKYYTSKFGTRFVERQLGEGDVDFSALINKLKEIEGKFGVETNHEAVIMSPVSGCHNGPWLAGYGLAFLRRDDEPLED